MDDTVQLFSDAKDEVHASPVWSTDGQHILFVRHIHSTYDPEQREQGLYIADVNDGGIKLVLASPSQVILGLTRSPQADQVAFRIGNDIYLMDFQGNSKVIGQGQTSSYPIWLPDGKTLLQQGENGEVHILKVNITARGSVFGGWLPALRQLDYFIQPGGNE
jgi:Tol biopolymer transport system component